MAANDVGATLWVKSDTAEKVREIKKEMASTTRHHVTIDEVVDMLVNLFVSNQRKV